MHDLRAVVIAQPNRQKIREEIDQLREYASERGLRVVCEIGLPITNTYGSRNSETLTGLVVASWSKGSWKPLFLVTNTTSLNGCTQSGDQILLRLRNAGWQVMSLDHLVLPEGDDVNVDHNCPTDQI